ncbi:MAG: FAD-binding oxidoreductase, partial [Sedimenticola sp.]
MSVDPHTHSDEPQRVIDKPSLITALREILPDDAVLTEEEDLRPYECDGLSAYRQLPLIVLLPETVDQVQQIMRLCHEKEIPVVARG